MDELAGGLRFTENELAVIAGKPGCEAGHHGDRGHFAAVWRKLEKKWILMLKAHNRLL